MREKLHISIEKAKEILGKDAVFGPEEFDDSMNIKLEAWFKNDANALNKKIISGWQLASEEILDNTASKNYKNQTKELIKNMKKFIMTICQKTGKN